MATVDSRQTGFANDVAPGICARKSYILTQTLDCATVARDSADLVKLFRLPAYFRLNSFVVDIQTLEGATLTVVAGLYASSVAGTTTPAAVTAADSVLASLNCNSSTGPTQGAGAQIGAIYKTNYDLCMTFNNAAAAAKLRLILDVTDMTTGAGTVPVSAEAQ